MPLVNSREASVNPDQLTPAGEPQPVYGPTWNGESMGGTGIVGYTVPYQGPGGQMYEARIEGDNPSAQPHRFRTQLPSGEVVQIQKDGTGQNWVEGNFNKRSMGETIFEDGRLMAFFATAALGAGAAAYSGGGAAAGTAAGASEAELLAGAGLSSSGGAGVTGAAGGYAANGAGLAAGTGAAMSGLPATAAATGGAGWLSQLLGSGSGTSGTGGYADMLRGLLGAAGSAYLSNEQQQQLNEAVREANQTSINASREAGNAMTGAASTWGGNLTNVANQSGQNLSNVAGQSGQHLTNVSSQAGQGMLAAGERAADMSTFRPYNVSGGLAGATFDGNSVTKTLDPRMKAIQDQSLSKASGFLGSVNAGTPDQLANQAYSKYLQWAKPAQDQQFAGLQNRLAAQGMLGLNVNTGSVQNGGGTTSVNPYYKDFAEGVTLADLKNYENSIAFGQQTTNNQIGMGNSMLGIGVGIDNLGNDAIKLGQSLGDSQAAAGARAGGFLTGAAQQAGAWNTAAATQAGAWNNAAATQAGSWNNSAAQQQGAWNVGAANNAAMLNHDAATGAANRLYGRQSSEATADAARDRAIWDSIWKTI